VAKAATRNDDGNTIELPEGKNIVFLTVL
jgi:hypothetical protein